MPVEDRSSDRLVGLIRDRLPLGETIGVALSGGGDSTALLHLALAAGFRVEAVTVDHRLRPESADEAARVAGVCAKLGVRHAVRVWQHGAVPGNLMDAARRARMRLIEAWATERGIGHVALGHTRDDQAETLLMGVARSAGIAGLSGMRPRWGEGVIFHRPLLDAGRDELRGWLQAAGIGWVDDPSNDNTRFTRIKARQALSALAPLGITAKTVAAVAGHLAQVQAALLAQVRSASQHLREVAGALQIDPALWDEPEEVQRQLVVAAVQWMAGKEYPPRASDIARLITAMRAGREATLAGCRHHDGWLFREARALGGPVAVGEVWDRRWRVSGAAGTVRALGPEGLQQCHWRLTGLPREVLAVTPGLWDGDRLIAAPSAAFGDMTAVVLRPFHLFGLTD